MLTGSPLEVLDDSIRFIGFDLRGAIETSKMLLGDKYLCPVMVNPIHSICVFPDKSANRPDAMWFNPEHIYRTHTLNCKAGIEFTNGLVITIPMKLYTFNHKLKNAEQFKNILMGNGLDPFSSKNNRGKGA